MRRKRREEIGWPTWNWWLKRLIRLLLSRWVGVHHHHHQSSGFKGFSRKEHWWTSHTQGVYQELVGSQYRKWDRFVLAITGARGVSGERSGESTGLVTCSRVKEASTNSTKLKGACKKVSEVKYQPAVTLKHNDFEVWEKISSLLLIRTYPYSFFCQLLQTGLKV